MLMMSEHVNIRGRMAKLNIELENTY